MTATMQVSLPERFRWTDHSGGRCRHDSRRRHVHIYSNDDRYVSHVRDQFVALINRPSSPVTLRRRRVLYPSVPGRMAAYLFRDRDHLRYRRGFVDPRLPTRDLLPAPAARLPANPRTGRQLIIATGLDGSAAGTNAIDFELNLRLSPGRSGA